MKPLSALAEIFPPGQRGPSDCSPHHPVCGSANCNARQCATAANALIAPPTTSAIDPRLDIAFPFIAMTCQHIKPTFPIGQRSAGGTMTT
jgi:hypothetical protein